MYQIEIEDIEKKIERIKFEIRIAKKRGNKELSTELSLKLEEAIDAFRELQLAEGCDRMSIGIYEG